ncbi:Copper chaperone [Handroanthus impetiginosus]|uniref:Copper chaperone n=1 Tax=Handroanthus impetiginosus TaxID=429701 RepID=A0A2G9G035_9LAMI|nr:Copper chaperone [Handroanthus impetiginosus]
MSKEEFLKIQTCVLKVNIHCDGCKQKVKKILQKIEGVYTTKIDSEQGKVTVSGNVDPATLIKKLTKNGKRAEIWGAPKPTNNNNNNNQNQLNNQLKNLQIDNGKGGNNNKGQVQKNGGNNNQPKVVLPQLQNPQMKGFQDLKLPPQFMDMKLPPLNMNKGQNQKGGKFNVPEDEGLSDDEYDDDDLDDEDYDYEDDEDDLEDDLDDVPLNKMKAMMGNGSQMPPNMMMNVQQMMKGGPISGANGGINIANGKKGPVGGVGNIPVQMNLGGGKGGPNGGNKGGAPPQNGGNQNQGGGKGGKNGGAPQQNGGQNKNGGGGGAGAGAGAGAGGAPNINNFIANGAKKGGGMNDVPHGMPNMMSMNAAAGGVGPMGHMPMNHMGNLPMSQMNNLSVHGMPAMNGGGGGVLGGGAGYYQGGGLQQMAGNPYYQQQQQQQLAAMMMNQQRANGNERFQPMMYARPPPAVNYMPPYPPYPYPPPPGERADQYSMFSDENTSSCTVM